MKVEIKEYCVRCGICVGLYPELFAHNFDKDCIDVKYDELPQVENISPLNRKTTKREYERLLDYTFSLGVTNAFLQEGPVAEESFIPEFDGRGI